MKIERISGAGWLALLGGGELTFGETEEADRAWLAHTPEGTVGFLPTASGSDDYGRHFAAYLEEVFGRHAETIPVYRGRDVRRPRSLERIAGAAALYLGGGVADRLVEVLRGTPVAEALAARLASGGTVVAIAAAAQALGQVVRGLLGAEVLTGLEWLAGGAIETNFDPGHDRRLRKLMARPEVRWGLGIPAGSAVLLGPGGEVEVVGMAFGLESAEGELIALGGENKN